MAQREFLILTLWRHRATSCLILFRSNRELNNREHRWFSCLFLLLSVKELTAFITDLLRPKLAT